MTNNSKNNSYFDQLDERQQLFAYKSYFYGFWSLAFLLWVQLVFGDLWKNVVSGEFVTLSILISGICVQTCYGIIKGAHPFMHTKSVKLVSLTAPLLAVLSLGVMAWSVWNMLTVDKTLPLIFGRGGSASMFVLYGNLFAVACSFLHRKGLDKLVEADED